MVRGTETSIEERELVVKLALKGKSLREIAQVVGRSHSTIQGIVNKFMDYGITCNKQGRGRKPILSEAEKRDIVLDILKNPHLSIPKLTSGICLRIGRTVSCGTIRRISKTVGYSGITDVGIPTAAEEKMNQEIPPAVDDEQMEGEAEFPNKKVRRRKKQLYQNIRKQMEFYFSDANVTKDRFLGKLIMEDPNIDISIFLRFNKIRMLTTDARDIANALRGSELLSVSEDGTKVFRTTPIAQKANTDDCTIYVEQLPSDAQHDWLKEVFSAYGNVTYVSIPKFKTSGKIKGFAFIEFETPEEANKTLEALGAMGCRLSPQMAPETLCSIQTFEPDEDQPEAIPDEEIKEEPADDDPENLSKKKKKKKKVKLELSDETNIEESDGGEPEDDSESNQPIKLKKRKKSDENEIEDNADQELVVDDDQPRKKKRKKSDIEELVVKEEEIAEEAEQTEVSDGQSEKKKKKRRNEDAEDKSNDEESESIEVQVSKKKRKKSQERTEEVEEDKEICPDEADQHSERKKRKIKSEVAEEVEETVEEQPGDTENEGQVEETGDEEGGEADGKKRRKRKKHKKKKPDVEAGRLKVLSKKEWKRLRNKYLDLQKVKMKCLKHYMVRNKWGKSTPARSQQSNGNVQEREETSSETTKVLEAEKQPRITFTPGVIVHAMLEEPVMDIRKFKADVKALSEVEYVDVVMGGNEVFIRCATSFAAENLISNAPWQQTEILEGDDEKSYWDRIFEDRHDKFSQKVRVKQRGRDKVLRKAERELGKHIRFDD